MEFSIPQKEKQKVAIGDILLFRDFDKVLMVGYDNERVNDEYFVIDMLDGYVINNHSDLEVMLVWLMATYGQYELFTNSFLDIK